MRKLIANEEIFLQGEKNKIIRGKDFWFGPAEKLHGVARKSGQWRVNRMRPRYPANYFPVHFESDYPFVERRTENPADISINIIENKISENLISCYSGQSPAYPPEAKKYYFPNGYNLRWKIKFDNRETKLNNININRSKILPLTLFRNKYVYIYVRFSLANMGGVGEWN